MNTNETNVDEDIFKEYNLEWNNDDLDIDLLNSISKCLG